MPLVRTNSKFWNISGIDIGLGLTGLKIKSGSINSLINSGIAFATPDIAGDLAKENFVFDLFQKAHEDWISWSPSIKLNEELVDLGELQLCEIR